MVGRPVRFLSAESKEDDDWAVTRLRKALLSAGFDHVVFGVRTGRRGLLLEMRLDHDELVLVADFGGGTSDFSLLRVGPTYRESKDQRKILGTEGVALAEMPSMPVSSATLYRAPGTGVVLQIDGEPLSAAGLDLRQIGALASPIVLEVQRDDGHSPLHPRALA